MNVFEKIWALGFVWPLSQLYRLTFQSLWNFLGNSWNYCRLICSGEWGRTSLLLEQQQDRALVAATSTSVIKGLEELFSIFTYKFDGLFPEDKVPLLDRWPTWTQSIRIHAFFDFMGNCQDSAHFTPWIIGHLNSNLKVEKKWKTRLNVYTPISPLALDKVHYFVSILSPEGLEYQVSNGKVSLESRDDLAVRYLRNKHKYIWLTASGWRD